MENSLPDTVTLTGIDRSKPSWWRRLTDCDPISLEPLRRLKVEPFELSADGARDYFFDGKILASYLVSTGAFAHPISRRELTREDCRRLDAHLRKYNLGKPCVEHAFDHKEDYKKQSSANNQVRDIQSEASELLRRLYANRPAGADRQRSGQEGARDGPREITRERSGTDAEEGGFEETVPLGGADIESAADFPTLGRTDAPSAPPPGRTTWVPAERSRSGPLHAASMIRDEEFPSLGGSAPPRARPAKAPATWGRPPTAPVSMTTAPAAAGSHSLAHLPADSITQPLGNAAAAASHPPPRAVPETPPPLDSSAAFPTLGVAGPRPAAAASGQWSNAVKTPAPKASFQSQSQVVLQAAPRAPAEFRTELQDFPSLGTAQVLQGPASREELIRRNKALMSALLSQLTAQGRASEDISKFKQSSAALQRGDLDADGYLRAFVDLFGVGGALSLFAEVAELLPDEAKRVALLKAFDSWRAEEQQQQRQPSRQEAGGRSSGWAAAAHSKTGPSWMYRG